MTGRVVDFEREIAPLDSHGLLEGVLDRWVVGIDKVRVYKLDDEGRFPYSLRVRTGAAHWDRAPRTD
jgi:hypothetical protein